MLGLRAYVVGTVVFVVAASCLEAAGPSDPACLPPSFCFASSPPRVCGPISNTGGPVFVSSHVLTQDQVFLGEYSDCNVTVRTESFCNPNDGQCTLMCQTTGTCNNAWRVPKCFQGAGSVWVRAVSNGAYDYSDNISVNEGPWSCTYTVNRDLDNVGQGQTLHVTWTSSASQDQFQVQLYDAAGTTLLQDITPLTNSTQHEYPWVVPFTLQPGTYRVKVTTRDFANGSGDSGTLSATFNVFAVPTVTNVGVNPSPAQAGTSQTVTWTSTQQFRFEVARCNSSGACLTVVSGNPSGAQSAVWTVPLGEVPGSYRMRVRVWASNDQMAEAFSGVFTIFNVTVRFQFFNTDTPESGTTSAAVLLTTSHGGPTGAQVSVQYATQNGTAVAPDDYGARSGVITFPFPTQNNALQSTTAIPIAVDSLDEATESFTVLLSNPSLALLGTPNPHTFNILDDDPTPSLSINDVPNAVEGNAGTTPATLTVTLSAASGQAVTVSWATADGTAVAGQDYNAASGSLVFTPGATSRTIQVQVRGDTLDEAAETFLVNLSAPANATISDGQGIVTITDDDPEPSLAVSDVQPVEGSGNAPFSVTLSAPSGRTINVSFATADGTALAGADYSPRTGTLTFFPGATAQPVDVPLVPDALDEPDETFSLNLSNPVFATIADGTGIATILDDDDPPLIRVDDAAIVEGDAFVTLPFRVWLSAPSGKLVTASYATADGSATAGADYLPTAGTLSFLPGATTAAVSVTIVGDTAAELDETFLVNLSQLTNTTASDLQAVGFIADDDATPLSGAELRHGSDERVRAGIVGPGPGTDAFPIGQAPRASYEAWVDSASGASLPLVVERLGADNTTVLQTAVPVGTGSAQSLRWRNPSPGAASSEHVRVRVACGAACSKSDTYRIHMRETTYAIPRFNNVGDQATVLMLQNRTGNPVAGVLYFWSEQGALLDAEPLALAPRQTQVLNTSVLPPLQGRSGSVTLAHDGAYGSLAGKAVGLDALNGFTFDTPLVPVRR